MARVFGAEFRRIDNRDHLGKPAMVAVATRLYDTNVDDLWNAVTTPERLVRWFLPVEGELKLGGRYQLKGNAGGTITRCEPPHALDLTWEIMGGTSWVTVRLAAEGERARFTLEHIAHTGGIGDAHMKQFGPGAVGVGWDLSLHGLERHVGDPKTPINPSEFEAWTQSSEGKAFIRASGEGWGNAHAEAGEPADEARAKAQRTIAFYTGG